MFTKSAEFYDAIYSWKDYEAEASRLNALIKEYKENSGTALLDVACGTGAHIPFLRQWYTVEGLDLDPNLLSIARQRNPDIPFYEANMIDFHLGRRFDVITCLFSAIGYVQTPPNLRQTLQTMRQHLNAGGLVTIEPWLTPKSYMEGGVHIISVNQPELKICRMNISKMEDGLSVLDFHYMVGTPIGIDYFTERHDLGLFTHDQYIQAFLESGLEVIHDPEGLIGRGLYIGRLSAY